MNIRLQRENALKCYRPNQLFLDVPLTNFCSPFYRRDAAANKLAQFLHHYKETGLGSQSVYRNLGRMKRI